MLFSRQRSVLLTRKRSADDSLLSDRAKVSKIEQTQVQAQSLVGTYSNPQAGPTTQWPAAYAQKTPPQVAAPAPAPTTAPALNPVAAPAATAAAPAAAWAPSYPAQVPLHLNKFIYEPFDKVLRAQKIEKCRTCGKIIKLNICGLFLTVVLAELGITCVMFVPGCWKFSGWGIYNLY